MEVKNHEQTNIPQPDSRAAGIAGGATRRRKRRCANVCRRNDCVTTTEAK